MRKKPSVNDRLVDPRLAELRESFRQCDTDRDGAIEFDEFLELLANLEAEVSEREARTGFREVDADDDGVIDFEEFVSWWGER